MKNIIGLWPNLFRALEIAKAGSFSVSVFYDEEYKNGEDDFLSIQEFCKGWFENFTAKGDIQIEIISPGNYEKLKGYETLLDIQKRIDLICQNTPPDEINRSGEELLKTATDKLGLSFSRVNKIKEIAYIIACLDMGSMVEAWHIVEAIHYSGWATDDKINACDDSKGFEHIISMKNVNMEWAIEELTRISERCSNTVQDDILTVIENLKRAISYETTN